MNKKSLRLIVLVCAVVLGLAAAYGNFCHQAKYLQYEVFDFNRTVSWQKKDGNIFRTASKGNFDLFLLAKDNFQNVSLKLNIINPRDCGIIFNYLDETYYHALYFDTVNQSVLWLKITPQGTSVVKRGILPPVAMLPVELAIWKGGARFSIKGQVHSEIGFDPVKGSLLLGGLMIKDADAPKVIFNDIQFEGLTHDGGTVRVAETTSRVPPVRFILALIFLCGMMGVAAFVMAKFFLQEKGAAVEFTLSRRAAMGIHLLAAALMFLPFIFKQHVLISSADNFGQIFPLFFFSKQNFLQILSGQGPILWNPYSHNGIPFFSNHWNMTYYPLNWPIFFLPDAAVLNALTFRTMAEVFLIGFLAYRLFLAEMGSQKWAMVSSLAYQLGSFLIFSFTLFPVTSLFFAMTLYLYTLWTMAQRRDGWNVVLLTFAAVLILTGGNMAFVFYGGLTVAVATFYRLASDNATRKRGIVLGGSLFAAFLISAIRLIPCLFGVGESNRIMEHFYTLHDRVTMFVRFFVPEIVGWLGSGFLNALTSPNWNFIYEQADLPSNSQNTFFAYFGIVPALLLLASLLISGKESLKFWKIYGWLAIALGLMIQPFWGIFNVLTFPFNHYSYYIIILPLGVCMLTGLTGKALEEQDLDWKKLRQRLGALVLLVQVLIIVMVAYLFPHNAVWGKGLIVLTGAWWLGLKYFDAHREKYISFSRMVLIGGMWVWFLIVVTVFAIKPTINKENIIPAVIFPVVMLLLVGALACETKRTIFRFAFPVCLVMLALTLTPLIKFFVDQDSNIRNYFLDMSLAQMKFTVLVLLFFSAWRLYKKGKLSPKLCGQLLILVVLADLVAFNYRFDNVVALSTGQAFDFRKNPYRGYDPWIAKAMDVKNYRMHKLHLSGFSDNENLIARLPSYSGIMGHMPKRFSNFIVNFGYPVRTVLIYPSESTDNARFLDLCAVKYTPAVDPSRANALSRLMFFTNFEVAEDEAALKTLKDPGFVPQEKVLLAREPGIPAATGNGLSVAIEKATTNQINASFTAASSGILLFVESYDKGWRAYVDGLKVDIVPANYAFMAIPVDQGEHSVVFRYEPPLYIFSLIVSGIGLFLFGIFQIVILRKKLS